MYIIYKEGLNLTKTNSEEEERVRASGFGSVMIDRKKRKNNKQMKQI